MKCVIDSNRALPRAEEYPSRPLRIVRRQVVAREDFRIQQEVHVSDDTRLLNSFVEEFCFFPFAQLGG